MKKLIFASALLLALSFTACDGGKSASTAKEGFDTLFTQAQADSLISAMGTAMGYQNREQFIRASKQDSTLSKEAFLKGVRYILNADTVTSYTYGMYTGFNLAGNCKQLEMQGIKVNRTTLYNNFQRAFMTDSVSQMEQSLAQEEAGRLSRQLREAQQAYEIAKINASEESQANIKRGREAIDSVGNAGYKVLASGVAYNVEQPGTGDAIKANSRVVMHYQAKTLDGRVFDKAEGDNVRPVLVSTRVPGLSEGLQKLSKGAKATIYVPGSEAYKENLNDRYGLGPNETVIYEVEIDDIVTE